MNNLWCTNYSSVRTNTRFTVHNYTPDNQFYAYLHGLQYISFIALNQYCVMKKRGPFPMNEMDHKFGKIVIFSKQYKILEIRKCYSMALVFTFDIPEIVSPGT